MRLAAIHAYLRNRDGTVLSINSYTVPPDHHPADLEIPLMSRGLFGWRQTGTTVVTFQWEREDDD